MDIEDELAEFVVDQSNEDGINLKNILEDNILLAKQVIVS
jgi:hypothetical protein